MGSPPLRPFAVFVLRIILYMILQSDGVMGQSQLLIILLGVFLIGVAIYFGISAFSSNSSETARSALINDLGSFASAARAYYVRASTQGGGGKSFAGMTVGRFLPAGENENGRYFVESAGNQECVLIGVGRVVGDHGDSIRVRCRVSVDRNTIEILE
jgi:hypothetical protein